MASKEETYRRVQRFIYGSGLSIVGLDFERPWGGFFLIHEDEAPWFIQKFFPNEQAELAAAGLQLSPKILVVEPGKRLSWQFHDFRAEYHRVIEGPVGYCLSDTDEQPEPRRYSVGDLIRIPQGTRHRLIGMNDWGVVAEIWQHTDPAHPSEEKDNHRLQDDSGRT